MSAAMKRALRTLIQAAIAAAGAGGLNVALSGLEAPLIATVQLFLTGLVSQTQNALENSGKIPSYLKPSVAVAAADAKAEIAKEAEKVRRVLHAPGHEPPAK